MEDRVVARDDGEAVGLVARLEAEPLAVVGHGGSHVADREGRDRAVQAGLGHQTGPGSSGQWPCSS
jgi:hypothetical protein